MKKSFQEKVDSIKKLTNKWSSKGLSIYCKVTFIKSLLIPKLVFVPSVLSPPSKIIKQVNSMISSFLWNGKDKVMRLSSINSFDNSDIKMIDTESLVKAVQCKTSLAKTYIFSNNESTSKFCLLHLLYNVGGLIIFNAITQWAIFQSTRFCTQFFLFWKQQSTLPLQKILINFYKREWDFWHSGKENERLLLFNDIK